MAAVNNRFTILPNEALYDAALTPAEFRMLAVLYSFRDSNANTVWPKLETIQERAGYSDATQVSRMTSRLESKGWLTKGKKRGPRGPKVYELTVPSRVQLGANSQVDSTRQVDISEQEIEAQKSQVDSNGQVDISAQEEGVNLTATVNSQLDRVGQLSNEHTSINKPVIQQISAAAAAAAVAALPVDNFTLPDLARIYASEEPETEIYNHGVPMLTRAGVEFKAAKNFLGMLINKHGEGRVLDALMATILEMPTEPKSYLAAVCQKIGAEIPKDWVPPAPCLSELAGMGIPDDLVCKARDPFVIFFREQGIRHNNFPELFVRWCKRDWERAEGNAALFRQRLAASGGFGEEFREPA